MYARGETIRVESIDGNNKRQKGDDRWNGRLVRTPATRGISSLITTVRSLERGEGRPVTVGQSPLLHSHFGLRGRKRQGEIFVPAREKIF
eukprot:scaffold49887_cov33-Tisochrysis_lutea.AAC.2